MTITTNDNISFAQAIATYSQNKKVLTLAERQSTERFVVIMTGYWAAFWTLNGLDKFFNSPTFFGVTRAESFTDYFARLGISGEIVPAVLSGIGVIEIVLGGMFALVLMMPGRYGTKIFSCLEASLAIFVVFSCGDILFGDRRELWEHACYIGLLSLSHLLAQRHFVARNGR